MGIKKTPSVKVRVPFNNLSDATGRVLNSYLKEVKSFLGRNNFILSPEVSQFEKSWAALSGTTFAVGVSSGADALFLALSVLDIGPGDEVIVPGNAYNASVTAILRVGAVARFADISPTTFQMDPEKILPLINAKTKAVMPVHLYGSSCDMNRVVAIAKKHNLFVVEDCAQAHLATWNGKKLGSFGDVSAFSFYPTKNLGAFGDAGALVTSDKKLYEKLLVLRNLGQSGRNNHVELGFNMRLDPLQAIALSLKLKFLKKDTGLRRKKAKLYGRLIKHAKLKVRVPVLSPKLGSVSHLYVVTLPQGERERIKQKMLSLGVETAIHYPVPVYRQPFWKDIVDPCPESDLLADTILSLPFYPALRESDQRYVIESLQKSL